MILTCPSCTMRYIVADGAVGAKGRTVRCASCGEQWFQEPEMGLDEVLYEPTPVPTRDDIDFDPPFQQADEDVQDESAIADDSSSFDSILQKEIEAVSIPEGVRPVDEELVMPPKSKKKLAIKMPSVSMERVGGFATALMVYAVILFICLFMQPQISRAWPPSNMLYGLVGTKPVLPGEGLALENLDVKMEGSRMVISGDVLNLKRESQPAPMVLATIVDKDNKEIERVLISPAQKTIKGEDHISFKTTYPDLPENARNVNFAFSYLKQTPVKKAGAQVEAHPVSAKAVELNAAAPETVEDTAPLSQEERNTPTDLTAPHRARH